MKTIWKVELRCFTGIMEVQVPRGAVTLSVHSQYDVPVVYLEVDTEAPLAKKTFCIVETGREIPNSIMPRTFIGTVLMLRDSYVAHVYELY